MLEYVICVMDEDQCVWISFCSFADIDKGTISFTVIYHCLIGVQVGVECIYLIYLRMLSMCKYIALY